MARNLDIHAGWALVRAKNWPWSKPRIYLATLLPYGGTTVWWGLSKATTEEWTEEEVLSALDKYITRLLGWNYESKFQFVAPAWKK